MQVPVERILARGYCLPIHSFKAKGAEGTIKI